jgi:hypothetical protein
MKFVSIVCAAATIAAMCLATAAPSMADPAGDAAGAAVVGGVLGFMAGSAAANGDDGPPPAPASHHWAFRQHVRMCEDHYGWRYDPDADLVHWHGRVFRCDDWPDLPPPDDGPDPDIGY